MKNVDKNFEVHRKIKVHYVHCFIHIVVGV